MLEELGIIGMEDERSETPNSEISSISAISDSAMKVPELSVSPAYFWEKEFPPSERRAHVWGSNPLGGGRNTGNWLPGKLKVQLLASISFLGKTVLRPVQCESKQEYQRPEGQQLECPPPVQRLPHSSRAHRLQGTSSLFFSTAVSSIQAWRGFLSLGKRPSTISTLISSRRERRPWISLWTASSSRVSWNNTRTWRRSSSTSWVRRSTPERGNPWAKKYVHLFYCIQWIQMMSVMFDPIKLGVKAVGNTVMAVPDQMIGGVVKIGAGINNATKSIIVREKGIRKESDGISDAVEWNAPAANHRDWPGGGRHQRRGGSYPLSFKEWFQEATSESIPLRVMVLLVDEVFGVRARNVWFRRQLVSVSLLSL